MCFQEYLPKRHFDSFVCITQYTLLIRVSPRFGEHEQKEPWKQWQTWKSPIETKIMYFSAQHESHVSLDLISNQIKSLLHLYWMEILFSLAFHGIWTSRHQHDFCLPICLMPISCPHTPTHTTTHTLSGISLGLIKQLVAGMHMMTWHIPSDFNGLKFTAYCWARHSPEGKTLVIWNVYCVSQTSRLEWMMCVSQSF